MKLSVVKVASLISVGLSGCFSPATRSRHLLQSNRCRNQANAGSGLVQWEAPVRGDPMREEWL